MAIDWGFDPEDLKQKLSLKNLQPGTILYIECSFTQPKKQKYLVLVCDISNPHIFLINTEPTNFIKKNNNLMECQIILKKSEYDFLDHDSFLDCSCLVQVDREEIEVQVSENHECIKGIISEKTKISIIDIVEKKARTISARKKVLILKSLKNK